MILWFISDRQDEGGPFSLCAHVYVMLTSCAFNGCLLVLHTCPKGLTCLNGLFQLVHLYVCCLLSLFCHLRPLTEGFQVSFDRRLSFSTRRSNLETMSEVVWVELTRLQHFLLLLSSYVGT